MVMQARVKFYNTGKGFGFITMSDENATEANDIFFHVSGITRIEEEDGTFRHSFLPEEGDLVEFELEDTDKGPKAVNIVKIAGAMDQEEMHDMAA